MNLLHLLRSIFKENCNENKKTLNIEKPIFDDGICECEQLDFDFSDNGSDLDLEAILGFKRRTVKATNRGGLFENNE